MNPNTFQLGDIVRLKCGGPSMVVIGVDKETDDNHESVDCIYFNDAKEMIHEREIPTFALMAVL